jgi:HAD superfamily hydrolase (TIGR01509 family)
MLKAKIQPDTDGIRVRCVLFDLDGTLTDTFELWYHSVASLVKKHTEKKLSKEEYEQKYWGADSRTKIRKLITEDPEKVEKLYAELQKLLLDNIKLVKTFPGVKETVEELSKNYKLAVISNSSMKFLEAQLKQTGIAKYFSAKIADAEPKPSPDGILKACGQLGVPVSQAVFVGDSQYDAGAGKNAGIRTIIIGKDIRGIAELGAEMGSG